jgi:hypothetical protein
MPFAIEILIEQIGSVSPRQACAILDIGLTAYTS